MVDARAEATLLYSRGTILNMQREHNRRESHLNANLANQLDVDRYPLSYPPPPAPAPPPPAPPAPAPPPPAPPPPQPPDPPANSARARALQEILEGSRPNHSDRGRRTRSESISIRRASPSPPSANSSSRASPSRSGRMAPSASGRAANASPPAANAFPPAASRERNRRHSVPRRQDPPPPTTAPYGCAEAPSDGRLFDTWRHVLKILHPVAAAERSRQKKEYQGEMQRAAADFVRAVRGREGRESGGKWIFFVGKETAPKGGGHGPAPATRLIRQIKTEMEAQRLPAFFARIDEYGTSKHCAHPWCVDAGKRRSE